MLRYIRESLPDIALNFIMTFSLSITIFTGFYVPASQASDLLMTAAVSLAITMVIALVLFNKRTILFGAVAFVVALVGVTIYSGQVLGHNILRDEESNLCLYYILILMTAVIVYLLSRARIGNALLFIGGTFASCLICFLYETEHTVCLLIFVCTCIASQIYRNYIYSVTHSETTAIDLRSAILTSIVVSLLIVGLGTGIFYGIIHQLDPPKAELKLITKYMSLEVLEKTGVATTKSIKDPNLETDKLNDETSDASSKQKDPQNGSSTSPNQMDRSKNPKLKGIKYHVNLPAVLILIAALILLILLMIAGKRLQRRLWLNKVRSKGRQEQICMLYQFYLKDFGRMNMKRSSWETELEYARRSEPYLRAFETEETGITELTKIFNSVRYGNMEPDDEQLNRYMTFHREFYINCRFFLGRFRYMLMYFFV